MGSAQKYTSRGQVATSRKWNGHKHPILAGETGEKRWALISLRDLPDGGCLGPAHSQPHCEAQSTIQHPTRLNPNTIHATQYANICDRRKCNHQRLPFAFLWPVLCASCTYAHNPGPWSHSLYHRGSNTVQLLRINIIVATFTALSLAMNPTRDFYWTVSYLVYLIKE